MSLKGPHHYKVTTLGSCVKWPLEWDGTLSQNMDTILCEKDKNTEEKKPKMKVIFKALDILWLLLQRNSDSETLDNDLHELSQLLTKWDNFSGEIQQAKLACGVKSAHKKGQMPLNVQPTSACNSGSTFPSGASFLFHSISLSIFLEKFVKGELCDNVDFKVRVITFEGQCFPEWYDNPCYLLLLFPFYTFLYF